MARWSKIGFSDPVIMSSLPQATVELNSDEIFTTAPCRADLAGGTLDIWPLYLFHPGAVSVNIAVNILTSCKITPRSGREIVLQSQRHWSARALCQPWTSCWRRKPISTRWRLIWYASSSRLPDFALETHSESPAGAGISGSSALMIATTAALARFVGREIDIEQIRVIAQNIEAQLIRVPTGCQDYYPAMYGGVSAMHLGPDGIRWEAMPVSLDEIDQRFVLFYTGAPRQSGINNWEVFKQHIDGDKQVVRNFAEISRIAQAMHRALDGSAMGRRGAPDARGVEAAADECSRHRHSADRQADRGRHATSGGRAAKVCGAGGGGCVIVFIEKGSRQRVEEAIRENGGQPLNFSVARQGLTFHSAVCVGNGQGLIMFTTCTGTPSSGVGVRGVGVVVGAGVSGRWLRCAERSPAIASCSSRLIFRPLLALLLIALFVWLLTAADHIEDHRIAALGLPRVKGWLKQFVSAAVWDSR